VSSSRSVSITYSKEEVSTGNGTDHASNDSLSALAGEGHENGAQSEAGNGDCSGLQHRYATTAHGDTNVVEDQMDELMKVVTALR